MCSNFPTKTTGISNMQRLIGQIAKLLLIFITSHALITHLMFQSNFVHSCRYYCVTFTTQAANLLREVSITQCLLHLSLVSQMVNRTLRRINNQNAINHLGWVQAFPSQTTELNKMPRDYLAQGYLVRTAQELRTGLGRHSHSVSWFQVKTYGCSASVTYSPK